MSMKKVNVTFSLPKETVDLMYGLIGKRKLSVFTALALQNALEQRLKDLRLEYELANDDPDSIEVIKDWSALDGEGWDE
jgi:hypothetical protein